MNPSTCAASDMHGRTFVANGMPASPGIPVSMARVGEAGTVVSISGKEEVRKYLASLGFTPGASIKAVSEASGSVILDVRGSKIAIDRKMATKILFCPES